MNRDSQKLAGPLELIAPMPLDAEFTLPGIICPQVTCDKGKIAASCAPNGQI